MKMGLTTQELKMLNTALKHFLKTDSKEFYDERTFRAYSSLQWKIQAVIENKVIN